jgi:O-antigen/teichoic acid export membrane protein
VLVPGLRFAPAWNRPVLSQLLRFGGVMQLATAGPVIADYVFRVLAGARFGVAYAGAYDLAARAGSALRSVAGSLFASLVPFGVHTLARGDEETSRLQGLAVKYTALFMLPASALLFRYAGPLMRAWLGTNPLVSHVQHGFQALLVAHVIASLAVPAAMLGRSAARPGIEALVTTLAAVLGLGASLAVSTFLPAVAVFAMAPALGSIAIWIWISARLGLEFRNARDLATIVALSLAGYLAAAVIEWLMTAAGLGGRSSISVAAAMLGAACFLALCAWRAGIVAARERALLRAAFWPMARADAAPTAGQPSIDGAPR